MSIDKIRQKCYIILGKKRMKNNSLRLMNYICIICAFSYVFAFMSNYIKVSSAYNEYERIYSKMLAESSEFNTRIDFDKTDNNQQQTETPLFYDAITAIDYAYNMLEQCSTREYQIKGSVNVTAAGMSVPVKVQSAQYYFASGAVLDETRQYELQTNMGVSKSKLTYYANGEMYLKETKDVFLTDDGVGANYSGNYEKKGNYDYHVYIINRSTIDKQLYFKVNYNAYTGKIDSYSASAKLNIKSAVKGYDKQIQRNGDLNALPEFSNLEIHCIIGADGVIKTATIKQTYSSKFKIFDYASTDEFNITFLNLNKELSVQEPQI